MILAIWNCVVEPLVIAFNPPSFKSTRFIVANYLINSIFMIDIIMNFRTSYTHSLTGDEILDPKKIASNYLRGIFWIDLLSVIPFDDILKDIVK